MCGIIGFIGDRPCSEILLGGLQRLEYRGYDSAGVAVWDGAQIAIVRAEGKLSNLVRALVQNPIDGDPGIGHTRWATHGRPSEQNAHPHKAGPVVVVHNGIIENHLALRAELEAQGRLFASETDTEIISHLIHQEIERGATLAEAVRRALKRVVGSWAIAVLSETEPDRIVAARMASPLVVGLGEGENFVASDIPAVLHHTRRFMFLEDGDVAELTKTDVRLTNLDGAHVERPIRNIDWSPTMAEKGGYKHFMLKEIHEQPRAVTDTLRGRISLEQGRVILDGLSDEAEYWKSISRVVIVACGTSWHAALVGKFWIEATTRLPVEVDLASEYRYRNPVIDASSLVVAISQSGETADTLAAAADAKRHGARILAICNVVESSLPRLAHHTVYTHAGPEIGVASTKAFVTQLAVLYLLSIYGGRGTGRLSEAEAKRKLAELVKLPTAIGQALRQRNRIRRMAERFHKVADFLFIGRWLNYPIALEGALKMKEISYIHAEGYPAGEMKHGPIALIDENMPVVAIATRNHVYDKILSNIQEAKARRCTVIALVTEGDEEAANHAEIAIPVPPVPEDLEPLVTVVPLQLLAYYVADYKGTDIDQPRNLAKSVTVE
ncbi:MAG: glutamine--fructose-6-phosphate transaminase (isomerizing) [Myxococcales bacterium]|nr:MAG: glutamine--fructose-6-phosphate transaminase (isomerizing) [Myxococcales bacterium]